LFDPAAINPDGTRGTTLQPRDGVVQGGNPALTPETTESYTAGIVITPRFLPGFTATVDFYQLFTRNVILPSANFAAIVLTQNGNFLLQNPGAPPEAAPFGVPFNTPPRFEDPTAPTAIYREEGTFLVTRIEGANTQNAGKRLVNGMDVTASYQVPTTNWGTFTLSAGYNYFFTWKAESAPGAGSTNFLGDYNNGTLPLAPGGLPYHKGFLRGEHTWKHFDFVATMNYISSFNDDSAFVAAANQIGGTDAQPQYDIYRRVSDYITLDMQLSYEFVKPEMEPIAAGKDFSKDGKSMAPAVAGVETAAFWKRMLWGTTLKVGVNNAFDRNPPTVLGAFNDNYDTSLYSLRNRYWYVGINKKF
jgi:iron complex outermembrane receptor protein